MANGESAREVSQSLEHDMSGSDDGSQNDEHKGGKPGRKQNPDAQQQRRIQNRVAQREFRLRKQQRIRDLEARVEMLSGSQGQSFEQMRNMLRSVMAENQHLRNLVRQLSEFMADGIGGVLPKMGFTKESFEEFITRGETDTAFYAFEQYKKQRGGPGGAGGGGQGQTLPPLPPLPPLGVASHDDEPASKKRKRPSVGDPGHHDDHRGTPPPPNMGGYTANGPSPPSAMSTFSALLDVPYNGAPAPYPGGPPPNSLPPRGAPPPPRYGNSAGGNPALFPNFPQYDVYPLPPPQGPPPPNEQSIMQLATSPAENISLLASVENSIENANPRQLEAGKLIKYHLTNYRNNHNYCLPLSLRPTLVQRTIPHDPIIDGIPHPIMRDRMILLKGRYDLVDCMHTLLNGITIHGDDVLAHNNWEISEVWLKRYGFLIDESVLASVNRWRKERGDKELSFEDLPSVDEAPHMPVQPYGSNQQTIGQL